MEDPGKEIYDIVKAVKAYLELERASGCEELFVGLPGTAAPQGEEPCGGGLSDLRSVERDVMQCRSCGLYRTRRNVVFGSGNPHAGLMFVGEAPGEDEDIQGLPFVGRAGQLLTKIIEAIGVKRGDVYIANVLKCRPPGNRMPLPAEIAACEEHLKKQIEMVKPKVICTLGKFASQTLLRTEDPITRMRGTFRDYHGVMLMPTFHPAYLLRNPQDKRLVWEDMKKVRAVLKNE